MNADVVDVRICEIQALLSTGSRCAGGQFSAAGRTLLEASDEM
jgi:hypothetical protein